MTDHLQSLRNHPSLSRIRRNHALEHATIHILNQQFPNHRFIGRSNTQGFFLYGDVPIDVLESAVQEALRRLRNGEHQLAIHPNCGTNLVTSAILAGTASFLTLMSSEHENWRRRAERLPLAIAATLFALIVSQPLGLSVQQHITTQGDPEQLEVLSIRRIHTSSNPVYHILTKN
ncbi:MAG: hypothetical protein E3J69_13470 [Anaerolineales bacterium]|nr:MAG: hypothetical protein E3J69_13470 [Anaerolineales bacterium]